MKIATIIIAFLIIIIYFQTCQKSESKTNTITVKETVTEYLPSKVIHKPAQYFERPQDTVYFNESEELLKKFKNENDSLNAISYEKAISLNEFSKTFEDSLSKVDVNGLVRGNIEYMGAKVTLKERKIPTPNKVHLYGGGNVNTRGVISGQIGFQNKKGVILYGGYDTEKSINLGILYKIF